MTFSFFFIVSIFFILCEIIFPPFYTLCEINKLGELKRFESRLNKFAQETNTRTHHHHKNHETHDAYQQRDKCDNHDGDDDDGILRSHDDLDQIITQSEEGVGLSTEEGAGSGGGDIKVSGSKLGSVDIVCLSEGEAKSDWAQRYICMCMCVI